MIDQIVRKCVVDLAIAYYMGVGTKVALPATKVETSNKTV